MSFDTNQATYLGDGVYASCDGYHVWLCTPRQEIRHEIALEPAVVEALNTYVRQLTKAEPAQDPSQAAEIGAAMRKEQHALRMEIERLRTAVRYATEHLDDAAGHIGNDHNAFADLTAARAYLQAAAGNSKKKGDQCSN